MGDGMLTVTDEVFIKISSFFRRHAPRIFNLRVSRRLLSSSRALEAEKSYVMNLTALYPMHVTSIMIRIWRNVCAHDINIAWGHANSSRSFWRRTKEKNFWSGTNDSAPAAMVKSKRCLRIVEFLSALNFHSKYDGKCERNFLRHDKLHNYLFQTSYLANILNDLHEIVLDVRFECSTLRLGFELRWTSPENNPVATPRLYCFENVHHVVLKLCSTS